MLRLTLRYDDHPNPEIRAEGRLVGEWTGLLEAECDRVLGEAPGLSLDLSGLVDVDARGVVVLRGLRKRSIRLVGLTPILVSLLAEENLS